MHEGVDPDPHPRAQRRRGPGVSRAGAAVVVVRRVATEPRGRAGRQAQSRRHPSIIIIIITLSLGAGAKRRSSLRVSARVFAAAPASGPTLEGSEPSRRYTGERGLRWHAGGMGSLFHVRAWERAAQGRLPRGLEKGAFAPCCLLALPRKAGKGHSSGERAPCSAKRAAASGVGVPQGRSEASRGVGRLGALWGDWVGFRVGCK